MSLLTPDRIPIGFALDKCCAGANLDKKTRIPTVLAYSIKHQSTLAPALRFAPAMLAKKPVVLENEGLGSQPFHGRIALLVDRHTASAAEMIVAFARERIGNDHRRENGWPLAVGHISKSRNGFHLALADGTAMTDASTMRSNAPKDIGGEGQLSDRERIGNMR
jgi:carboxyl-terminal processing protease